mmetsp:Transcript_5250/g.13238  ORF Transcript_5250/g.13238 Transcript_5250/m.13238 type:complete len:103 (-) Transcript_5250:594-902(-)
MPLPAGPFVYQSKKSKSSSASNTSSGTSDIGICELKCRSLACDIQKCLSRLPPPDPRTGFVRVSLCDPFVDKYNACCEYWKKQEEKQENDKQQRENSSSSTK